MQYFEQQGQRIIWRNRGETLVVEPWGPDSLRVRSVLMGEVRDERFALLDPVPCQNVEIGIEAEKAFIRCGKITARLEVAGWQRRARLTFLNQKGEVLLQETDGENALVLQARKFEPIIGGDYALTATFQGMENEHIYGMGQYQEEYLDWKGCTLELAHRNSQASVPFYHLQPRVRFPVAQSRRGLGILRPKPYHLACGHDQAAGLLDYCWRQARGHQPALCAGNRLCTHDA